MHVLKIFKATPQVQHTTIVSQIQLSTYRSELFTMSSGMTAMLLAVMLAVLQGRGSAKAAERLTPQIFLQENSDIFAVMNAATARVVPVGGLLADILANPYTELNATVFLALDSGFVQASNRTVEDMVKEIRSSSLKPVEMWLSQWITAQTLPTPDSLLEATRVISLSGEGLSFRLAEDETTIILSADGVAQGAGKILGPASIPMGQVTAYVVAPIEGGNLSR